MSRNRDVSFGPVVVISFFAVFFLVPTLTTTHQLPPAFLSTSRTYFRTSILCTRERAKIVMRKRSIQRHAAW